MRKIWWEEININNLMAISISKMINSFYKERILHWQKYTEMIILIKTNKVLSIITSKGIHGLSAEK